MQVACRWLGKRNWTVVMIINWVIFTVVLIAGVGFGIWAAITGIIGMPETLCGKQTLQLHPRMCAVLQYSQALLVTVAAFRALIN